MALLKSSMFSYKRDFKVFTQEKPALSGFSLIPQIVWIGLGLEAEGL
jgi:hypothetical protein